MLIRLLCAHEMTKHVRKISRLNSKRLLRKLPKISGATLFCRTLYITSFNRLLLNRLGLWTERWRFQFLGCPGSENFVRFRRWSRDCSIYLCFMGFMKWKHWLTSDWLICSIFVLSRFNWVIMLYLMFFCLTTAQRFGLFSSFSIFNNLKTRFGILDTEV